MLKEKTETVRMMLTVTGETLKIKYLNQNDFFTPSIIIDFERILYCASRHLGVDVSLMAYFQNVVIYLSCQ